MDEQAPSREVIVATFLATSRVYFSLRINEDTPEPARRRTPRPAPQAAVVRMGGIGKRFDGTLAITNYAQQRHFMWVE